MDVPEAQDDSATPYDPALETDQNLPLDSRAIFLAGIVGGRATHHTFNNPTQIVTTIIVDRDRYHAALEYLYELGHTPMTRSTLHPSTTTADITLNATDSVWCCLQTPTGGWYAILGQPRPSNGTLPEDEWYRSQRAVAAGHLAFRTSPPPTSSENPPK